MTRDEILALESGPRMDALIHKYVMCETKGKPRRYSLDISMAWKVLTFLLDDVDVGGCFSTFQDKWGCVFGTDERLCVFDIETHGAIDADPKRAICLAALLDAARGSKEF